MTNDGTGMSLRDWFAGQAMVALLSLPLAIEEWGHEDTASEAYNIAAAMLAERQRRQEQTETATPPGDET